MPEENLNTPSRDETPVKPTMTDERLKIWIDLFKWFIVSVVIAAITLKINSGFQDREISIKELGQYDDYLSYITNNDSLNQRLELAEYFSRVLASKQLRERWEAYRDFVKMQKDVLQKNVDSLRKQKIELGKRDSINTTALWKAYAQVKENEVPVANIQALKKDSAKTTMQLKRVEEQLGNNIQQLTAKLNIKELKKEEAGRAKVHIDVFYLEGAGAAVMDKANAIKVLLDASGVYVVTVKELFNKTNAREGYQLKENEIRYDSYEKDLAKALQQEIGISGLKVNLSESSLNTPAYLSVFIVK